MRSRDDKTGWVRWSPSFKQGGLAFQTHQPVLVRPAYPPTRRAISRAGWPAIPLFFIFGTFKEGSHVFEIKIRCGQCFI